MKKSSKKGFTLVETLVAIAILVLGVTGAYAAANNGLTTALYSKDQITAFYLAQEAIEQIRNMRDQNGLSGLNWLSGIANPGDPCAFGNTCYVDALASPPTPYLAICSGTCPNIKLNSNGFYTYGSGTATKFRRDVVITQVSAASPEEVDVKATVYWNRGLINSAFSADEHLFNWQ